MPIFMDRHDMAGTCEATEIAAAHLRDLEVQGKYGVRYLTYWFDYNRGTAFCLVDAPNKEAAARVHREAHGGVANEIIEVNLAAVEAFLGRVADPRPDPGTQQVSIDPGFRAVLFTDIVGFTEMTARLGDADSLEIIHAHDTIVRRALHQTSGREVKRTGDGLMAAFASASAAVDCAGTIQRALARHNEQATEPIHVRIGIDAGEPVEDSDDLFGTVVLRAFRLCVAARPNAALVSDVVRQTCDAATSFTDLGELNLKGFTAPVRVFELAQR